MSVEDEEPAAGLFPALGVLALPAPLVSIRPDSASGMIVTLRPGASATEIVAALMLCPPGLVWTLPPLGGVDGAIHLLFSGETDRTGQ